MTTTADAGPGSLRQAIEDANAAPGADTITFDIPEGQCSAAGVCEIPLLTELPALTGAALVDATTQPRYGSAPDNVCATSTAALRPRLQLNGEVDALLHVTSADAVTIRGFALVNASTGIRVDGGGAAVIQCNLFGVSADGASRLGIGSGVCISCSGGAAAPTVIGTDGDGTDDVGEGNVFAAAVRGVNVNYGNDHVIAGNSFGLRPDGVTRDDVGEAIFVRQGATRNRIGSDRDGISDELEKNVFAYGDRGVVLATWAGSGDDNLIVGNWFGVDASGEQGSLGTAIWLQNEGQSQVVAGNRIEGAEVGLKVADAASLATMSTENCFQGNGVGLRHEGSASGIAAAFNWWGDASGPSGLGSGSGDGIDATGDGSVNFDPWLTSPGDGCLKAPAGDRILIPAAAAADGAAGSYYVTDLEVYNRGGSRASFVLKWLPRDTDNTTPISSATFTVEPNATRRFANVLDSVFGLAQVAGALLVEADSSHLAAMSRTFNRGAAGTFGQSMPGIAEAQWVVNGTRVQLLFMVENDDFRSNLGLVNTTDRPLTVTFERFDADGHSLGVSSRTLPAWGNTQVNRVFSADQPIEAAHLDVWTDTQGGAFACYGSVLDNKTSDPTTVLAN